MSDRYDEMELAALVDAVSRADLAPVVRAEHIRSVFRELGNLLRLMSEGAASREAERVAESLGDFLDEEFEETQDAFLALSKLTDMDMSPEQALEWADRNCDGHLVFVPEEVDVGKVRKYIEKAVKKAKNDG